MSAHVRARLSELLDGALSASDRSSVEKHLASCRDCARALERLRTAASLVKALPQQPLPTGFMQRLERRRAQGEGASSWTPPPARLVAFALCSLMACFVLYDQARQIMGNAQGMITGASGELALPSAAISTADLDQARSGKPARELARAKGEPYAAVPAPATDSLAAVRGSDGAGGAGAGYTNEMLQADLERQKKEMGIKGVVAKAPEGAAAAAALLRAADAAANSAVPQLNRAASAQALRAEEAAARKAAPQTGSAVPSAVAAENPPPAPTARAEGLIIVSDEERRQLWEKHGLHLNPPSVNWNKNRMLVVLAPDMASAVEIIAVRTQPDKIVVAYNLFARIDSSETGEPKSPVRAYQFRVVPKSDKPTVFERLE